MAEDGEKVTLNVYDLSNGLARQLSTTFLGRAIEGIWHTGVVVYGNEYFFGGGIQHAPVGTTQYGTPIKVVDLGFTHVPKELFEEYLEEISPRYTAETYNLLRHNCNNFSNEVVQFLVGSTIPDYILQLPNDVLSSPMGAMILPMIQQLETTLRSGAVPQTPQFRPPALSQSTRAVPTTTTGTAAPATTIASNKAEGLAKAQTENNLASSIEKGSVSDNAVPPKTTTEKVEKKNAVAPEDPLGDARAKVQEEIGKEFTILMASGTLSASEAATQATRKVMERYGRLNNGATMPQS